MSNILYIGPYREFSGAGNAARNYIKAMILSGHNISIRPIYNTFKVYPEFDIDNDILELENNFQKKYHVVFQHCYPHQYCLDSRFDKTIGISQLESLNYNSRLQDYLKIPDKIIAPSNFVKRATELNSNIDVIPIPIDINTIEQYKQNKQRESVNFSFYIIADFIHKSNILKVVEAFLLAFDNNQDIDLVIKTKNKTQEHSDLYQVVEYEIGQLNNRIAKYHNKPKIIIGETKKEAIFYIHNNSDCYIDMSSGRSFGYSALEAMVFDNKILALENTAQSELITNTDNLLVNAELINCRDDGRQYDVYNTIDQKWATPSIEDLIIKLQRIYLEYSNTSIKDKTQKTKEKIQNYTMESVSKYFNDL